MIYESLLAVVMPYTNTSTNHSPNPNYCAKVTSTVCGALPIRNDTTVFVTNLFIHACYKIQ